MQGTEARPAQQHAERPDFEVEVRQLLERGDPRGAATRALRVLGPEIMGFLVHALGDAEGADAFSLFAEDLWLGLGGFRWECALRAWAYRVARHASCRAIAQRKRRMQHVVPLSDVEELSGIVQAVRTETATFLRTQTREKLDALRAELTPDERMLLVLRIDRKLSWPELADVWTAEHPDDAAGDAPDGAEARSRRAARLRKRFQLLKDRIARRSREMGVHRARDLE